MITADMLTGFGVGALLVHFSWLFVIRFIDPRAGEGDEP